MDTNYYPKPLYMIAFHVHFRADGMVTGEIYQKPTPEAPSKYFYTEDRERFLRMIKSYENDPRYEPSQNEDFNVKVFTLKGAND